MTVIRLFLVDDHRLLLAGVRAELGDGVEIVGEASDVETAVEGIRATRPDVVLLDVHLPDGTGGRVIKEAANDAPTTRFLALSVSDVAEDVIGTIHAGARGYVTKSISPAELGSAIRRVHDGDAVGGHGPTWLARVFEEQLHLDRSNTLARGFVRRVVLGRERPPRHLGDSEPRALPVALEHVAEHRHHDSSEWI